MNKKHIISAFFTVVVAVGFSQETPKDTIAVQELKISFLDSIKKTFVKDDMATCVDERWAKELDVLDQFDEMTKDIATIDLSKEVDFELPTDVLKERLRKLDEKSPFNIEYNQELENLIKNYLKNRRKCFERLMGISQFYFPIFEEAMAKHNIPLEIKYLAVVESALKPKAVSRAKATGLWQFMFETGRQYGLKIDSYVDERSNELKASEAAAIYMKNSYDALGDWELVLASYNSGLGNVTKAIRRSGGQQNFWNIKKYLPRETQSYVPAFLATMYIFEYHKEHGIVPDKALVRHFDTDTVAVKQHLTFKQIADLLDMPIKEIEYFNPSFKRNEIPYITGETPHFIRLPKNRIATFVSNEEKIYAYATYEKNKREKAIFSLPKTPIVKVLDTIGKPENTIEVVENKIDKTFKTEKITTNKEVIKYYKVKRGDNLSQIAGKFDVALLDLKKWNKLKSNEVQRGDNLKIITNQKVVTTIKKEIKTSNNSTSSENPIVAIKKQDDIKQDTKEPYVENYYVVVKGDNLNTIAKKFGVSKENLKQWNNKIDTNIKVGDQLIVSGETTSQNTAISNNFVEHFVKKDDNLSSIARQYNTTIDEIKKWNKLENNSISLGQLLHINLVEKPNAVIAKKDKYNTNVEKVKMYSVQRGDTLFSISKKFPGVTISDIKKWNNIKSESLQPGMKLKING